MTSDKLHIVSCIQAMGLQEPEVRDLSLLRNVQIGSRAYRTSEMRGMGSS